MNNRGIWAAGLAGIILSLWGCAAVERCVNRGEGPGEGGGTAVICARMPWNRTGIILEKGRHYRFEAEGSWRDGSVPADASGFIDDAAGGDKPFPWMRRVREAPWLTLVGTIGRTPRAPFDIGSIIAQDAVFTAPESGELFCFVNDAHLRYFNNAGAIRLKVIPVSGPDM